MVFGGFVGGSIASLLGLSYSSSKTLLVIYHSRIHLIYMCRCNGILWKIKEKAMRTENNINILRGL
jgi:hypothetical protein